MIEYWYPITMIIAYPIIFAGLILIFDGSFRAAFENTDPPMWFMTAGIAFILSLAWPLVLLISILSLPFIIGQFIYTSGKINAKR
jgi:hypothetical protein